MNPPDNVFDLGAVHILQGIAIAPGVVCERCARYFATVDEALAVPCGAA